jgi:hypothetical protein
MLAVSELDILDHLISATDVAPLRDNVQAEQQRDRERAKNVSSCLLLRK